MTAKQTARRLLSPLLRPSQDDFPPTGDESFDTKLGRMLPGAVQWLRGEVKTTVNRSR